jgi:hypothetical protein
LPDWTEEQVRAYLPRLRQLLAVLQRAAELAVRIRGNGHGSVGGASAQTPSASAEAEDAGSDDAGSDEDLLSDVTADAALSEIEEGGIVLRDLDRGLVDFPSRHPGGREVLLCWQLGEDDLAWWHLPEDGFAGRRPLPLPPEL